MIRSIFLTGVMVLGLVQNSNAQSKSNNNDVWFHYAGKNMLSKKLSLTLEGSVRFANGLKEKQQWFVRPSVDYHFAKSLVMSVGYTYYDTYVYGEIPMNKITIPEHHVWWQTTFVHNKKELKFTHRLRDENRFVGIATQNNQGKLEISNYEYRNRLRYMFLLNHPLLKKDEKTKVFAVLGDEVFVNIGVKEAKTVIQQNRIIGGFGYNFDAHHQIQLNYIHQNIWNLKNTIQENNPTIRISYITNFDWFEEKLN
ncbi:DUF2490 domain-containing protein [Flavobacterium amnicola]|uniref:DUF2490 domain-containing protein n=1 Tax=Flavobacterium amnicola TaxID=2506422 RepID=UPI001F459D6C|nr:DUF2490 domain-containing protein [Flavobacterium amnicola]